MTEMKETMQQSGAKSMRAKDWTPGIGLRGQSDPGSGTFARGRSISFFELGDVGQERSRS